MSGVRSCETPRCDADALFRVTLPGVASFETDRCLQCTLEIQDALGVHGRIPHVRPLRPMTLVARNWGR